MFRCFEAFDVSVGAYGIVMNGLVSEAFTELRSVVYGDKAVGAANLRSGGLDVRFECGFRAFKSRGRRGFKEVV